MVKETRIATAIHYTHQNLGIEAHQFSTLAHQGHWLTPTQLDQLRQQTGLADLYWRTLYYKFPGRTKTLEQALAEAEGYVFFLHGWDGTHRIWEDLPLRLTVAHQRLVCFNFDVNGFGLSPFSNDPPSAEQCTPAALMTAIELWLTGMKLWPTPRRIRAPFYLFVGHSMGGAALFYKSEIGWRNQAYGLYALAPALFCNDIQQQTFFKTVGLGLGLPSFAALKTALAPHIMEILAAGASPVVKNEHVRVFARTPFGTLAQTLYVLGDNPARPQRGDWPRFRVALGQKDRLIRVENMLQLLDEFGLQTRQIRVTPGDHYFFSYGDDSPPTHKESREALLDDLLAFCHQLTDEAQASQD